MLFPLRETSAVDGRDKTVLLREIVKLSDAGELDKAIEACRQVIKEYPEYPEAYDQLGYLLLRKKSFDEAAGAFNEALRINRGLRTSKTGLGIALLEKGDAKGAEAVLTEALFMNPYPSMTHYALGLVYERTGDLEKAIREFKDGIRTYKNGKR
jgi:tetratricopeptide (TPR) repeat protein